MKIEDRVYELISGKLDDVLSEEEERELSGWLEADGEHRVIFDEMRRLHEQAKLLRREFNPDVEGTLRRLKVRGENGSGCMRGGSMRRCLFCRWVLLLLCGRG